MKIYNVTGNKGTKQLVAKNKKEAMLIYLEAYGKPSKAQEVKWRPQKDIWELTLA